CCSDQMQLKNLAIVHQEAMLRQERCLQELTEGLATSRSSTRKKEHDETEDDYEKVESVVHFQLDEVSDGADGRRTPRDSPVRSCTSGRSRAVPAIPPGDRELPRDELLLPVIRKGSTSPVDKRLSSRDAPKFGQRFITTGQESEPDTVAFEIIGLASHGSPRRTLASSAREMASSAALGRYCFHWVAEAIEWCENCREPERVGFLADIVKSHHFGGLCMT
ncbi:fumA, partial [Symbiodinium pilosum]